MLFDYAAVSFAVVLYIRSSALLYACLLYSSIHEVMSLRTHASGVISGPVDPALDQDVWFFSCPSTQISFHPLLSHNRALAMHTPSRSGLANAAPRMNFRKLSVLG